MTSSLQTKIEALATKINNRISSLSNKITTHEEKTSSNLQKGHAQAGGTPQTIGTSLSAGTDNGYYARADHVHTVKFNKILNVPDYLTSSSITGKLDIAQTTNKGKNVVVDNTTGNITFEDKEPVPTGLEYDDTTGILKISYD